MTETKRKARVHITPEKLADALQFDRKTRIAGCQWVWKKGCIELYLEGPQFSEVEKDHEIPLVSPGVQMDKKGKISYEWNQ